MQSPQNFTGKRVLKRQSKKWKKPLSCKHDHSDKAGFYKKGNGAMQHYFMSRHSPLLKRIRQSQSVLLPCCTPSLVSFPVTKAFRALLQVPGRFFCAADFFFFPNLISLKANVLKRHLGGTWGFSFCIPTSITPNKRRKEAKLLQGNPLPTVKNTLPEVPWHTAICTAEGSIPYLKGYRGKSFLCRCRVPFSKTSASKSH